MEYNLAEKLAIVKMVDSVIYADGIVHSGEIGFMGELMKIMDFNSNLILQARNIANSQSLLLLCNMTNKKKVALADLLEKVALSDGFKHEKELELLLRIFAVIGIDRG